MSNFRKQIWDTVRRVFDLGMDYKLEDLQYRITPGWDSIAHMALVAELEDEFNIMIDTIDVIEMSDFNKIEEIIERYLSAKS